MVAEVAVVFASLGRNVIIKNILEIGVHYLVFILEVSVEGGAADLSLGYYHIHRDLLEVMLCDKAVKSVQNSGCGSAQHGIPPDDNTTDL